MDQQFLDSVNQILTLLGSLLRPLGALIIGTVAGWFTTLTFLEAEKPWQLQIAVFLGLLGAFVTLGMFAGAGTVGAFALGSGVGVLIVLLVRNAAAKPKKE